MYGCPYLKTCLRPFYTQAWLPRCRRPKSIPGALIAAPDPQHEMSPLSRVGRVSDMQTWPLGSSTEIVGHTTALGCARKRLRPPQGGSSNDRAQAPVGRGRGGDAE